MGFNKISTNKIYSKRWKQIFSKISHNVNQNSVNQVVQQKLLNNFYKQIVLDQNNEKSSVLNYFKDFSTIKNKNYSSNFRENGEKQLSKKDRQILRYRTFLTEQSLNQASLEKSQSKSSISKSANSESL